MNPNNIYTTGGDESNPDQKLATLTLTHSDSPSGVHIVGPLESTYNSGLSTDTSLGAFLKRPVKIFSGTWSLGTNFRQDFAPWALFFSDTQVRNRLEGFRHVRGHLKLRITVTGNPSLFGRVMAAYRPRATRDVYPLCQELSGARTAQLSQLPHVFLDPATGEGAELTLPFFCPETWLDLTNTNAPTDMGTLYMTSLNALQHATGGAAPASFSVFAWMEDANICTPTSYNFASVTHQAGMNEFASRPISKSATAVANIASLLSKIPFIAPYAKATETVSSTVAGVAHAFGFSRPQILEHIVKTKEYSMGEMSSGNTFEAVQRFALDCKGELTVDPRTVGLSGEDELAITNIVQREAFIHTTFWPESGVTGDSLRTYQVSPFFQNVDTSVTPNRGVFPPMTAVAQLFRYWRGTVIFKFQVACSAYHRGKLRIVYDPVGNMTGSRPSNEVYSRIIDIAETRDFEIPVAWHAAEAFLECARINPGDFVTGSAPSGATAPTTTNGVLRLEIFDTLTSPDPSLSQSVSINVFVKGGPDMEFAYPYDFTPLITPRSTNAAVQPQAGLDGDGVESSNDVHSAAPIETIGEPDTPIDALSLVHFGEKVVSLRTLMKRYVTHAVNANTVPVRAPIVDDTSIDLHEYIMSMYAGWRGSMRFKTISNTDTAAVASGSLFGGTQRGIAGQIRGRRYLEFELPFLSNKRFEHARTSPVFTAHTDTRDLSMNNASAPLSPTGTAYRAIGEDFQLFFFVGLPPMYGD